MSSYFTHHVFICQNQRPNNEPCCAGLGSVALLDYAKQRIKSLKLDATHSIRVNKAGCLGRCELGPAIVIYPEGTWYTAVDKHDIDEIIDQHIVAGKVVERLRMDTEPT